MKKRLLGFFLTSLAFSVVVLTTPNEIFGKSIEITSQNIKDILETSNANVLAANLETEAAQAREGLLARSFFPSFELYGTHEAFKSGTHEIKYQPGFGAEAKMNLFNGRRDQIADYIRNLDTEKKKYHGRKITSQELEKARITYWEIRYLQENLQLLKSSLVVNKRNLESAMRRIKSGVSTDSDRFEFEMKDVELRREIAENEIKTEIFTRGLKILLAINETMSISFPEQFAHDHEFESLLKHTTRDHEFLIKESEILSEQFSLMAKQNKMYWLPKLDAYASYNQFNERQKDLPIASDRTEAVFGFRLSINLQASIDSNKESFALLKESMAAKYVNQFLSQEVEAHLHGELAELTLLHNQLHEAEENILRAESYYKITQSEYGRGVKNSPDVMGASEKLFTVKQKRLAMIKNFHLSKAHVLSKIEK